MDCVRSDLGERHVAVLLPQTTRLTAGQHCEQVGRADLRLEMRARWSARRGADSLWLCRTFFTQQPAPSDRLFPSRVPSSTDAPYDTFGAELAQRASDRGATDRW